MDGRSKHHESSQRPRTRAPNHVQPTSSRKRHRKRNQRDDPKPNPRRTTQRLDPEQYVEDAKFAASSPERLPEKVTQPPAQDALYTFHPNSTYKQTKLGLVAIENWMEILHTQTKSCIFLAKGNWQARQAATAISMAKGRRTYMLSKRHAGSALQIGSRIFQRVVGW